MALSDAVLGNLATIYVAVIIAIKVYGLISGQSFSAGFVVVVSGAGLRIGAADEPQDEVAQLVGAGALVSVGRPGVCTRDHLHRIGDVAPAGVDDGLRQIGAGVEPSHHLRDGQPEPRHGGSVLAGVAPQLFEVLARHPGVRGLAWGHTHQPLEGTRERIRLMGTPSTCMQFAQDSDEFEIDDRPPAYRWIELGDDGGIETGVEWVEAA